MFLVRSFFSSNHVPQQFLHRVNTGFSSFVLSLDSSRAFLFLLVRYETPSE